jgi:penicillin-binding protein 1A
MAERGWRLAQPPQIAGALVAVRPGDGAILVLAGGFDFFQSSFNRVTQAQRQPGSSLKPFIYAAALDKGFTAASTVSGAPIVIEDTTLEDEWRPEDYSHRFYGPTRLREALAKSLNLVSVRLLRTIGASYAADYLGRFGFNPDQLPRNLSLALGTGTATPLDMARAFAVFASGGYLITPYFITRVEDTEGGVLERAVPLVACPECETAATPAETVRPAALAPGKSGGEGDEAAGPRPAPRVLSPELAFIMTDIMKDVIREGTGRGALALRRNDLAGKTGTTNEYRDAWFTGFNRDIVVTAWVGFDQPAPLGRGETGARAALPMWVDFMRTALHDLPEKPLTPPPGVVRLVVNRETGKPTHPEDPAAMEEYLVTGQESGTDIPGEGEAVPIPAPEPVPENIRRQLF